jgi:hypothetical protein
LGLPEINRARIEQIYSEMDALNSELSALSGTSEGGSSIVITDENYPDIKLNPPTNVRATPLFRTIQLVWAYNTSYLVGTYEVYASQNQGFTPLQTDLVWRGRAGDYQHKASVGETWYFRVRVINVRGTPSDFSDEVSGTTVDISGFEIDEQYQIDTISYANQYTQERETAIMTEVADKLDAQIYHDNIVLKADTQTVNEQFDAVESELLNKAGLTYVNGELALKSDKLTVDAEFNSINASLLDKADTTYVNGQLALKADGTVVTALDTKVSGIESDVADKADATWVDGQLQTKANASDTYTMLEVDNALNSKVSSTTYSTDQSGVVTRFESAESRITQNETDITSKVAQTTYDTDIGGIESRLSSAETSVTQNATDIGLRATKTELTTGLDGKADNSTVGALDTRVTDAEASINVNATAITSKVEQSTYDTTIGGINTRLSDAESSITQNATSITSKVGQTEFNGVEQRVSDAESTITQHATQIQSKVDSTTFNALEGRMDSAESSITQNATAITSKVSQSTYNTDINNATTGLKVRVSSAESTITQHADEIASKVETTTFNALEGRVDSAETSITQNATDISLKASQSSLNALTDRVSTAESDISVNATQIGLRVTKTEYDTDINDATNGLIARMNSAEASITTQAGQIDLKASQEEVDTRIGDVVNRLDSAEADISINATAITQRVTNTTFNALEGRVDTAEASISTQAGQIALKASQSSLDSTNSRLSSAESSITANATSITSKVSKDGVVSSINQTAETVKIQAAKIDIQGDLTVTNGLVRIKSAIIDSVHIKDGALIDRLFSDEVITNRMIAGGINAEKVTTGVLSAIDITGVNIDGSIFTSDFSRSDGGFAYSGSMGLSSDGINFNEINTVGGNYGEYSNHLSIDNTGYRMSRTRSGIGNRDVVLNDNGLSIYGIGNGYNGELDLYVNKNAEAFLGTGSYKKLRTNSTLMWADAVDDYSGVTAYTGTNILETPEAEGIYIDNYGNFMPKGSSAGAYWSVFGYDNNPQFKFHFQSGKNIESLRSLDMMNNNLFGVNAIHISDPGGGEGIIWDGGNGWSIVEAPFGGTSNGAGFLHVMKGSKSYMDFAMDSTDFVRSPVIFDRTYTYSSNMYITGSSVIGRTTSARKYKIDEQPIAIDVAQRILNVIPKDWFDKNASEAYARALTEGLDPDKEDIPYLDRVPGVVAEDVEAAGLSQFVTYSNPDESGNREITGVMYDRLWALLIPLVREALERIGKLENMVE